MNTLTGYVPYDYRRCCDLCGNLWNRSQMYRQGQYMVCSDHVGERTDEELDRANARQRPFRVLPVPYAKPEDQSQPDVFVREESMIFELLDHATRGGARYLSVDSGSATSLPNAEDVVTTNAWASWYYYGLATATYPKGHQDLWRAQALTELRASADVLVSLQSLTGSRNTNPFYGGFLATGGTTYFCEDAAVGGLAVLYAYRLLRDGKYLAAARAAASFLRNLQAIGSDGTHFTASDVAGTARLYTGGITNAVSTTSGFYADHRFYASSLLALWFWNELKLTDGDQSLGAGAVIAGSFDTAPAKTLSASMDDLREFWATGTYDVSARAVLTGLSTTTPAECFNAYPAVKPNSSAIGTGAWEFVDGNAATGTKITGLSLAKGIASLHAVDGLSAEVLALAAWLQTFTSNPSFETAATTSRGGLQHAVTGSYDPTQGIAKYLLVRDPHTFASATMNGASLYDWGAFGLLSPVWSTRPALGFKMGRVGAAQLRRRLSDGLPSDGFWDDSGLLRGRQGLAWQTGFREALVHGGGPAL